MLIRCVFLVTAVLCLTCCSVSGDTKLDKLTSFRPISQAEYEAILSLTDGKTVVSEGRLINGGLAALVGLTSGWVTSLRFPNIFGSFGSPQKTPNTSYPLCVIRTEEAPGSEHHHEYHGHHEHYGQHEHHEHHEHHSRQRRSDDSDSHESSELDYHQHLQQHGDHSNEDVSGEHDSSIETVWNSNKLAPVVNCIVVLRDDVQDDDDHHTTTRRPRRKRRKHRPRPVLLPVPPPPPPSYQPTYQYPPQPQPQPQPQPPPPPPPSPSAAYPYAPAQSPYPVGPAPPPPPPPGSYNSLWYWPTPQYNPYYSESTTFTGIYPPAYPDIYATTNPGAYTRNYPGAYSGSFAAPLASNNPGTYYDAPTSAYPDPPPSAYPGDSYNPQPSSFTSDYPNREISLNRESPPSNSEPIYNYGPPPNDGSAEATGQLHYSEHYDERIGESHSIAATSKKSASAAKVPTKSNKQKTKKQKPKRTAKPRPSNDHIDYESAPTKGPIRRRHTKAKRDESGIQTNSYAKIASYSERGYQPTLYPQNNYQSNYPKVSYSYALPYPAPVYVRNSIEESSAASNTKQYRPYATEVDHEGHSSAYTLAGRQN